MKKIIIITGVFLPEPIVSARLMADLAERLSERYDVAVLRPHSSRPMGFKVPECDFKGYPYQVVEIDAYVCPQSSIIGRFRESVSYGKACIRYMELMKNELSFVYNGAWHLFGRKTIAEFCKRNNIPNMTPVQDIYPESLLSKLPKIGLVQKVVMSFLMPYDLKTLRYADKVHTISNGMRDYLSETRGISKDRFVVVRNWQDEREFTQYANEHTKQEVHPFTFMFMGNVGALAGLDVVVYAFAKAHILGSRLVIAGSGSAKEGLKKQVAQYTDCDIQFWNVPLGRVPETQFQANVMLLPIKRGFTKSSIPSKLSAYMFSSKPILASVDQDSDIASCIIKSGAGWVCEPEDADKIAKTMIQVAQEKSTIIESMGKRGYEYAFNEFSRTVNLEILANACIEVIEGKK